MIRSFAALVIVSVLAGTTYAQRAEDQSRYRVANLTNQAADALDHGRYGDAIHLLKSAIEISPNDLTCLYDLACATAEGGDPIQALDWLQRANALGFSDMARIEHDPMLGSVRKLPQFHKAFEPPDHAIHLAAEFQVGDLKAILGDEYTVVADEPLRLVYAVRERSASLAETQKQTQSLMLAECTKLFGDRPQQFVRIIIASQVDYARLETRSDVRGSYDDATRTVLVRQNGPELRHEFTHALHAADQHIRGQQHPVWLVEGLAVAFENGDVPSDNWRLANVQAAMKSNYTIPLSSLISTQRSAFNQRSDLIYGEVGELIVYLHDKNLLEPFYKQFVATYANDRTGRQALDATTSMSIAQLEADWRDWVIHRTAPIKPR